MVSALVSRNHVRQLEPILRPAREPDPLAPATGIFNGGAFTFMRDAAGPRLFVLSGDHTGRTKIPGMPAEISRQAAELSL
jgi:hypothetical protein